MIQNLILGVLFLNILFQLCNFIKKKYHYLKFQVEVDIIRVCFLISGFLAESIKVSKIQRKRSLILQTVSLKKPYSFYEPQLTRHWKKYSPATQPKTFLTLQITNFYSKNLVGVRKNICTAPFLNDQELHSQSTLKASVCSFLYISVRKILFQRGGEGQEAE